MAKTGKHKAGPGRPPAGPIRGKMSNFSTRITAETRAALETEARATNLSQAAEQLLRLGLAVKRERLRGDPTRALCYLIAELAETICPRGIPALEWQANPFMFEAFKLG